MVIARSTAAAVSSAMNLWEDFSVALGCTATIPVAKTEDVVMFIALVKLTPDSPSLDMLKTFAKNQRDKR